MNPKTYRAESMAAALSQVKRDLGRDAVILSTRTIKRNGVMGLCGRTQIEITARREQASAPVVKVLERASAGGQVVDGVSSIAQATADAPVAADALQSQLQDIRAMVHDLVRRGRKEDAKGLPAVLRQAYTRLIQNEVAEELADELIQQIHARQRGGEGLQIGTINELLTQQIARLLAPACPIQLSSAEGCTVVALVGPTGVGKTTTIAKLAAHYRLKAGKKVGLITTDTYRIAAVEQLRTYARIIDVPLEVVLTPPEIKQALKRLKHCDVVFVDTAGRSQFDGEKLTELRQFMDAADPHEIHMVLSANCSRAVLLESVNRFASIGVNRVIFTKMDEAVGVGTLLSAMQKLGARLSYITTGQDVPDDFEVGDGRRLAQLILNGPGGLDN